MAIEATQPRLAAAFQLYTFNVYLWAAFVFRMACLVLSSERRRAATLSFNRAELAAFLALLAIMAAPAIILYFNLFPQSYARRANKILTSDNLLYVFRYAAELSINAALCGAPWLFIRTQAAKAASMARWSRAKTTYDDAPRAAFRDR